MRYMPGDTDGERFLRSTATDLEALLQDRLGSIREVLDSSGSIIKTATYDAFGNITTETGSGTLGNFRYAAYLYDIASTLYNMHWRWYNPQNAQWTTEDPIGLAAGDPNFRRYAGNNGLNGTDLSGLEDTEQPESKFLGSLKVFAVVASNILSRTTQLVSDFRSEPKPMRERKSNIYVPKDLAPPKILPIQITDDLWGTGHSLQSLLESLSALLSSGEELSFGELYTLSQLIKVDPNHGVAFGILGGGALANKDFKALHQIATELYWKNAYSASKRFVQVASLRARSVKEIRPLVDALGSNQFHTRQNAEGELRKRFHQFPELMATVLRDELERLSRDPKADFQTVTTLAAILDTVRSRGDGVLPPRE
jgi:RHS repeat-associated protein